MSENVKLPPEVIGQKYSEREQAFKNCTFFTLRKVATEGLKIDTGQTIYLNGDGKPFCDYNDTIRDRNLVRQRILDYELAQGWLVDDRGAQEAVAQIVQSVPQPVVQPIPEQVQMINPTPIIAAAHMTVTAAPSTSTISPAPTNPQPQPPPPAGDVSAPLGKKRPGPRLPSAVAPPTTAVQAPVPPPGAIPVQLPPAPVMAFTPATTQPAATQPAPAPVQVMSFSPPAIAVPIQQAPAPAAQPVAANSEAFGSRLDVLGKGLEIISKDVEAHRKDFGQFVSNMSDQVNSQNKSQKSTEETIKDIQRSLDLLMSAIHHIYLSTPGLQQTAAESKSVIKTAPEFREYLSKFTPQRP